MVVGKGAWERLGKVELETVNRTGGWLSLFNPEVRARERVRESSSLQGLLMIIRLMLFNLDPDSPNVGHLIINRENNGFFLSLCLSQNCWIWRALCICVVLRRLWKGVSAARLRGELIHLRRLFLGKCRWEGLGLCSQGCFKSCSTVRAETRLYVL